MAENIDEARKLIIEEENKRVADCKAEVETALNKYKCAIDVSVLLNAKGIQPIVNIIPLQ